MHNLVCSSDNGLCNGNILSFEAIWKIYFYRDSNLQVIQKMPAQKRRILANNVQELVASIRAEDIATLMALLAGDVMLRQRILRVIVQTVEEQANVRVSNFDMWSFIFEA